MSAESFLVPTLLFHCWPEGTAPFLKAVQGWEKDHAGDYLKIQVISCFCLLASHVSFQQVTTMLFNIATTRHGWLLSR